MSQNVRDNLAILIAQPAVSYRHSAFLKALFNKNEYDLPAWLLHGGAGCCVQCKRIFCTATRELQASHCGGRVRRSVERRPS
jgi:hypothetical protein